MMTSVRKPLFEMCYFHTDIARKEGGDVKACQDGLERFFSTFACFQRGGSKATWVMLI